MYEVIEEKFETTVKPIEQLIKATFQYRDDFKLILLNMLSNFETKMNKISEMIKENKEVLELAEYFAAKIRRIVKTKERIINETGNTKAGAMFIGLKDTDSGRGCEFGPSQHNCWRQNCESCSGGKKRIASL